jgi:glycosyltransferase involved in cell wall biosynthesis
MHIALDATAAVRQYAGVGRFARGLLSGLHGVDEQNRYTLLTFGRHRLPPSTLCIPERAIWRTLPLSEHLATLIWQRARLPLSPVSLLRGPDVFFTPDYLPLPSGRVPSVISVHDLSFLLHPECAEARLRRYLSEAVPRAAASAAAVVAVSQTTAAVVHDLLHVPSERIHVVPNGVDTTFREPLLIDDADRAGYLAQRFGLTPGYVLSVGTLEPRKNYTRLLQGFALARRQGAFNDSARRAGSSAGLLVIAGREGWLYEPIFREVARLGLRRTVQFITRFDDTDLRALYAGAGGFIYPSVYEGFGIPPLEALASGVPVAASRAGALPEVLEDAAVYFDPNDGEAIAAALHTLVNDAAARRAVLEAGRRRVAEYTWERSACALLAVLTQVAA